jgi:hypothetical protein
MLDKFWTVILSVEKLSDFAPSRFTHLAVLANVNDPLIDTTLLCPASREDLMVIGRSGVPFLVTDMFSAYIPPDTQIVSPGFTKFQFIFPNDLYATVHEVPLPEVPTSLSTYQFPLDTIGCITDCTGGSVWINDCP